jgi:hypothetical protein
MAQEATARILSSSQGGAGSASTGASGAVAASSPIEAQEVAQSKRARRGLALELGPSSALREALAAKLELLADGLPVGLQLSNRNFTTGANGHLLMVEGQQLQPSTLGALAGGAVGNLKACLRMVEFCCADLATRGEQLLALLWALYAHEAPRRAKLAKVQADALVTLNAGQNNNQAVGRGGLTAVTAAAAAPSPVSSWNDANTEDDGLESGASSLLQGPSAYDKVFLEVLLLAQSGPRPRAQQEQQQQAPPRRTFRPLKMILLEAPALPDGLCAAVARRGVLDPYGSRSNVVAASPQAVKTGLNVLKVCA